MSDSLIVLLAGGDAFRYGQSLKDPNNSQPDKLLSSHGNTNLLRYVTDELRVLGNLVLVTRGEKRRSCYCTLLNSNNHHQPIAVIREDQRNSIGPLGGIYAALQYYPDVQTRLILPADLPNVRREVISEILMKASQLKHFDIISIVHPNGQVENLLLVINGSESLKFINSLIKFGVYRVSSLIRSVSKKCFLNSSFLESTKDGTNIANVFTDLDRIDLVSESQKKVELKIEDKNCIKTSIIDFGSHNDTSQDPSLLFHRYLDWIGTSSNENNQKEISSMVGILKKESKNYRKKGLLSISLHCLLDAFKLSKDIRIAEQIEELKQLLEH